MPKIIPELRESILMAARKSLLEVVVEPPEVEVVLQIGRAHV